MSQTVLKKVIAISLILNGVLGMGYYNSNLKHDRFLKSQIMNASGFLGSLGVAGESIENLTRQKQIDKVSYRLVEIKMMESQSYLSFYQSSIYQKHNVDIGFLPAEIRADLGILADISEKVWTDEKLSSKDWQHLKDINSDIQTILKGVDYKVIVPDNSDEVAEMFSKLKEKLEERN